MNDWVNLHLGLESEFRPSVTADRAQFAELVSFALCPQLQVSIKFQIYVHHSCVNTTISSLLVSPFCYVLCICVWVQLAAVEHSLLAV